RLAHGGQHESLEPYGRQETRQPPLHLCEAFERSAPIVRSRVAQHAVVRHQGIAYIARLQGSDPAVKLRPMIEPLGSTPGNESGLRITEGERTETECLPPPAHGPVRGNRARKQPPRTVQLAPPKRLVPCLYQLAGESTKTFADGVAAALCDRSAACVTGVLAVRLQEHSLVDRLESNRDILRDKPCEAR